MWQYNNISLIHYGVKGMKWGVRRKQDELDRISGRAYKIETLENGDKILKKGSSVRRVSADPKSEKTGHAYVSFRNADVKGYRNEIVDWVWDMKHIPSFELHMKVKRDMLIPNEYEKVKSFIAISGSEKFNTIAMAKVRQQYKSDDTEFGFNGKPALLAAQLMKQGMSKNTASSYALFSMALHHDDNLKNLFFEDLKKKGYDAIEDLEDSYSHRIEPLIVFERETSLKIVSAKKLPTPNDDEFVLGVLKESNDADEETKQFHEKKFTPTN